MTVDELREITSVARISNRNKAQEYLEMTGYQLMKKAAENGEYFVYMESIPELKTLLEEQGFMSQYSPLIDKIYVSWQKTPIDLPALLS